MPSGSWPAALLALLAAGPAACQSSPRPGAGGSSTEAAGTTETAEPASTDAGSRPPKTRYDVQHDAAIKEIFKLAEKGQWAEAETQASQLYEANPDDLAVGRIYKWVVQQGRKSRTQAVEDKIREIDAKNSVFNPTLPGLLMEDKDRGLPARKDVRDVVEQIEATPYIPDSYGKSIIRQGPLFELEQARGRMDNLLDKVVSIHLDNATVETIIFNVGQAEGINFVADKGLPAFKQTLSVNLEKVRLEEFLRYLARNLDIQFQIGEDLIWIVDGKDPKKVQETTRFYRLRHGFVLPAEFGASEVVKTRTTTPQNVTTEVETQTIDNFVNDGADRLPAIEQAIKEFFDGKFLIDYERNLIVARGTTEQLQVMDRIVTEFDRPIQQVLIEARFITISQGAFMQLGMTWETGRDPLAANRAPNNQTGLDNLVGLGIQLLFTNILGRADLTATLNAIEQSGEAQTLSAPRITLINNLPATISDGLVQYYYEEYQVKQQILETRSSSAVVPAGKPTKIQSGVTFDVIASIGGDGKTVLLGLNPTVNQNVRLEDFATITDTDNLGRVVSTFNIRLPQWRTQSLATRVAVRSGETIVMGGVLEREQRTFVESVPILGNLPIIGAAFRSRTEVDRPRYLLIFVKASILSESGEFITYQTTEEGGE